MFSKETWFILGTKRDKVLRSLTESRVTVRIVGEYGYGFCIESEEKAVDPCGLVPERFRVSGDVTPARLFFRKLQETGGTSAFVESCTGGLCSKLITDIPGSSELFWGGWVVYSNSGKRLLGVSGETLENHGAVSKRCVLELAVAGAEKSGADICISVSGIAGPAGGSSEKPVGTVWIGAKYRGRDPKAWRFLLPGDRSAVREKGSAAAFLAGCACLDEPA